MGGPRVSWKIVDAPPCEGNWIWEHEIVECCCERCEHLELSGHALARYSKVTMELFMSVCNLALPLIVPLLCLSLIHTPYSQASSMPSTIHISNQTREWRVWTKLQQLPEA
jgi:hypothetical protein